MPEYARILTNHEEMEELTDLIRMNGTGTDGQKKDLVEDTILYFEDGEVNVKAFDPMASIWLNIQGPFEGIRNDGSLVIGNIVEFIDYIERFGDRVIVTIEEQAGAYNITFTDEERKDGAISAKDEALINSVQDVEALPFSYNPETDDYPGSEENGIFLDTWFACDVDDIKDVIKDGDTTGIRKYPIEADNGHVTIRVGEEDGWIETSFDADGGEGQARSVYAYGVDNIFNNLSGKVEFYFMDEGVSWIHQSAEDGDTDYQIDYMMAEDEEGV